MRHLPLFVIFLLGFFLRVISLSSLPVGFTPDEASFGYDAYSILHTGKDQWGHTFPLVLESFGDFKPPLYSYILIPFVGIFGLSEQVVRFPNAFFGSFVVIATYFLVLELGGIGGLGEIGKRKKDQIALIASFLLSVSPWHVLMSRGAFEANLTTFLMPLGILFFLKGLKDGKKLISSSFVFGLNLFSYHSAKLLTPLIFFFLLLLFWKEFSKLSLRVKTGFFSVFFIFLSLTAYTFFLGAGSRVSDVSIFGGAMQEASGPRLEAINSGTKPLVAKVFHNKFQVAGVRFLNNYRQYFSYKYLFKDGPAEATYGMIPGRGMLYLIELPLVFGFLLYLFKALKTTSLKHGKGFLIILFWLIVSPIPASLATGPGYSGNRSVIMLPSLQIALSLGAIYYHQLFRERKMFTYTLFLVVFVSFVFRFSEYITFSKFMGTKEMLYGRREMVEYLTEKNLYPSDSSVVIDKRLSEPQIFIAFYMKIDPYQYQKWSENWEIYRDKNINFVDQLDEYEMGQYLFTTNFMEKAQRFEGKNLLVGKPEEFSEDINPEKIIYYPGIERREPAIYIVNPAQTPFAMIGSEN